MSFRFVRTQRVIENSKKNFKKLKNPVMASFQAKIGWKRWRNGENKNCLSVPFVLDGKYKIPNKEKKIGWKMPRKRKNKNCLSVPFR